MATKGELPELIFVSPIGHGRHKMRHVRALFLVEEWDEYGRPLIVRMCHDKNQKFDLEDVNARGIEFMTGYIPIQMTDSRVEKANKKVT